MENKTNSMAVASLVLGIVSIVLCWAAWFALIGLAAGIVAIIFGVKARKIPGTKTGMATAGLVMGIIGTVLSGIFVICVVCIAAAVVDINNNINNMHW